MSLVTWQAVSNRDGSSAAHKLHGLGAARGPWLWLPADCGARPVRQVYRSCLRLYAMKARRHKAAVKLACDTKPGRMDDFPATQKTCKAPLLRCELDLQFPAADLESRPSRQPQMQIANHRSAMKQLMLPPKENRQPLLAMDRSPWSNIDSSNAANTEGAAAIARKANK